MSVASASSAFLNPVGVQRGVNCGHEQIGKAMTIEEKVGQVIMAHFNGETANDAARALIQGVKVGGIILYNFSNGLNSPEQVRALNGGLQQMNRANDGAPPLLIAADQEGGIVTRLSSGFTVFPGNMALGMTSNTDLAEDSAFVMGKEMRAVGINMNLAPVVDVNDNPDNPVIGIRSYGDSARSVTEFGYKALKGYHRANMITCLKHFIGHGNVDADPHKILPVVKKSKEELMKVELSPFYQLAKESDAVMTAHLMAPALDDKKCVTLSSAILQGILRKEIGFEGVVVSDSLVMEGVLQNCGGSVEEAAIAALSAGCDLLILGGKQLVGASSLELMVEDIQKVHAALVQAVKTGRIGEQQLNASVERILQLKKRYPLSQKIERPLKQLVATDTHLALSATIARRALKIRDQWFPSGSMSGKRIALIAPKLLQANVEQLSFQTNGHSPAFFDGLNPSPAYRTFIQISIITSDIIVFFSYNAWKNPDQLALISELNLKKPLILIVTRDPHDASCVHHARRYVLTYSPTVASLQAAVDTLSKE